MVRPGWIWIAAIAAVATCRAEVQTAPSNTGVAAEAERLLRRWAPTYVQHVADGDAGADRPTRIDFDGDWDVTNNWDNQARYGTQVPPVAYGAAILTASHAYLTYTLYYPRDWQRGTCAPLVCHDNDLETVVAVVARDRGDGALVALRIKAHLALTELAAHEFARGADGRPLLAVEAEGHGISACRAGEAACDAARGTIVYAYGEAPGAPPHVAQGQRVTYGLLSLRDTLWARRSAAHDRLWSDASAAHLGYAGAQRGRIGARMGAVMASRRYRGCANPPWAVAGPSGVAGDWFLDPAGEGGRYIYNTFLDDLRAECEGPRCAER